MKTSKTRTKESAVGSEEHVGYCVLALDLVLARLASDDTVDAKHAALVEYKAQPIAKAPEQRVAKRYN